MKPGQNHKFETKKRAETTTIPCTLTEDQQRYQNSQAKPVGPSFGKAIVKLPSDK